VRVRLTRKASAALAKLRLVNVSVLGAATTVDGRRVNATKAVKLQR